MLINLGDSIYAWGTLTKVEDKVAERWDYSLALFACCMLEILDVYLPYFNYSTVRLVLIILIEMLSTCLIFQSSSEGVSPEC